MRESGSHGSADGGAGGGAGSGTGSAQEGAAGHGTRGSAHLGGRAQHAADVGEPHQASMTGRHGLRRGRRPEGPLQSKLRCRLRPRPVVPLFGASLYFWKPKRKNSSCGGWQIVFSLRASWRTGRTQGEGSGRAVYSQTKSVVRVPVSFTRTGRSPSRTADGP